MNPLLLDLGPFQVHWYGLLIVFGALVAAWISTLEAKRRGEDPEHVWNLLIWVLILGIIGARLYHVFSTPTGNFAGWAYYREHPIDIIAFWNGGFRGLGIYGAVLGGILGVIIYVRIAKDRDGKPAHLKLSRWLDILIPGLLLAQAIGRMGNRINQELFGPLTNLPWAFHINPNYPCQEPAGSPMACGLPDRLTDAARQWYAENGFHPTFFYEAIWNLIGFALVMILGRKLVQMAARRRHLPFLPDVVSAGPLLGGDVPARRLADGDAGDGAVDRHRRVRCGVRRDHRESPAAGQG